MKKRGTTLFLIITTAVMLSLLVIISIIAFSDKADEYETETTAASVSEKPETRPPETTETHVTNTPKPTETTETSETTETVMTSETTGSDIDHLREVFVYSVWYDAVDSNPVNYDSIESKNASALKGVFYFSEPLSVDLQARLYKDNSLFMTRVITLKDNVTAEVDFSASMEDSERFKPGEYYVELLLDGEPIATTTVMRVK